MTPAIAGYALTFLSRVDIKGAEAPAMMEVILALQQIARLPAPMPGAPTERAEPAAAAAIN